MQKTVRYRANISTSVKGIKTPECTVEITYLFETSDGKENWLTNTEINQEIMLATNALNEALNNKYPVPIA